MNGSAITILLVFIIVAAILHLAGVGRDLRVYPAVVLVAAGLIVAIRSGAL
jgi:hypothetical protein